MNEMNESLKTRYLLLRNFQRSIKCKQMSSEEDIFFKLMCKKKRFNICVTAGHVENDEKIYVDILYFAPLLYCLKTFQ